MINNSPTFNRKNPNYFNVGKPLVEDTSVIYINLDGFARYYLDMYLKLNPLSNLGKLMDEGIFFNNLKNALPSITNPCQNMILSGATSVVTKNVYRYYDVENNIVIQQRRENKAMLLSEAAVKANRSVVSIMHFLTQKDLTSDDQSKLYITEDKSDATLKRGIERLKDNQARFNQLFKLINKEPIELEAGTFIFNKLPELIIFYVDDLDSVGHNEESKYLYPLASTEANRLQNIMKLLDEIDQNIGKVIKLAKENNVYQDITFFITTDHGMAPFGYQVEDDQSDYTVSKLSNLMEAIKTFIPNTNIEFLRPDEKALPTTNCVLVGANLNVQVTFLKDLSDLEINNLKQSLQKLNFVGTIKTRNELINEGYDIKGLHLIISPKVPYFFSKLATSKFVARGQHDSISNEANHIPGWIFGKGIKKVGISNMVAYNYDFGTTIAATLGLVLPDANGQVLDIFDK